MRSIAFGHVRRLLVRGSLRYARLSDLDARHKAGEQGGCHRVDAEVYRLSLDEHAALGDSMGALLRGRRGGRRPSPILLVRS